jgi:hypothetical protein
LSPTITNIAILAVGLTLIVGIGACKQERDTALQPTVSPVKKRRKKPGRRTALTTLCQRIAVRRAVSQDAAGEVLPVSMPPTSHDAMYSPAQRRMLALKAVDLLEANLRRSPHDHTLYHQMGLIYLNSLDNYTRAEGYLCRAHLEAPERPKYIALLRSTWLRAGLDERLELSLEVSQRKLSWRQAVTSTNALTGIDEFGRVKALDRALKVLALLHKNGDLFNERVRWSLSDLFSAILKWAAPAGQDAVPQIQIAGVFSSRYRRHLRVFNDRANRITPKELWPLRDKSGRAIIHGRGTSAVKALTEFTKDRLNGKLVSFHVQCGHRRLILRGSFRGSLFHVTRFGGKPDPKAIRHAAGG